MKILQTVKKVPGGMMVVPLLLGILVNTLCPKLLQMGGLTTSLWGPGAAGTGIAITMFCVGSQINVRQAGEVLKRGIVLTLAKFLAGAVVGILIGKIFGLGGILGISSLAIVSSVTNSNGGLYMLWSSFFVTLVAKKIVLINLCCRPCFIWGSITIITVWTNMIIINVCKFFYLLIECFLCCKLIQICAFILQGIEVTLHRCIVVRISCFAHALCHIYRFAEFGKCFGRIL